VLDITAVELATRAGGLELVHHLFVLLVESGRWRRQLRGLQGGLELVV
jgi:hypothetical protein